MIKDSIKNKKVLLMGLGTLGGGINTAKWLIKEGVKLTITDLKPKEKLSGSLRALKPFSKNVTFVLGRHRKEDFLSNDIIVVNPDVPLRNPYVKIATDSGKQIENELSLFYKFASFLNLISVTGTRGKTTVTNWVNHLLKSRYKTAMGGNSPDVPLLNTIKKCDKRTAITVESPSFLLEYPENFKPHVAIITNLYIDHQNRYKNMEEYAETKSNIFKNQNSGDFLILNYDNHWTDFFIRQKPKSKILFFSLGNLSEKYDGAFIKNKTVFIRQDGKEMLICGANNFISKWGEHNLENFLASVLAAFFSGVSIAQINKRMNNLPQIKFRQELIYKNKMLSIYNDTSATSPDGAIAALDRFGGRNDKLILITGGTDRSLDFKNWAKTVKKFLSPQNVIFLDGSATDKMKKELKWNREKVRKTLKECLFSALGAISENQKNILLFSPASKSFEKFKNEYDRGEKFNKLVHEIFNSKRN